MASLILAHDMDAELKGLNEFPNAHPPVAPVFWSFRVMVGVGMLMLAVAWSSAWLLWRRKSPAALPRAWLWVLSGMAFSGWASCPVSLANGRRPSAACPGRCRC